MNKWTPREVWSTLKPSEALRNTLERSALMLSGGHWSFLDFKCTLQIGLLCPTGKCHLGVTFIQGYAVSNPSICITYYLCSIPTLHSVGLGVGVVKGVVGVTCRCTRC